MSKLLHFGKAEPPGNDGANMSLVGHLSELRRRIALVGVIFVIALLVCFYFIREIADYLLDMGLSSGFTFVYLAPSELLTSYFSLAISVGLCVALPVIMYQGWCFVAPALTEKGKKAGHGTLLGGFVFFVLGVLFAYFVALPAMVQFLVNFNTSEYITPSIAVGEYLNFVVGICMTFGLVFEMPMLAMLLSAVGILRPEYMIKTRMYATLVIFIVAAVITPPDVLSQFMVAIPMIALYYVSIWVSRVVWKRKVLREEKEESDALS